MYGRDFTGGGAAPRIGGGAATECLLGGYRDPASFIVGKRTSENCLTHLTDLEERLANRVQLTTDGFRGYPWSHRGGCNGFWPQWRDYGTLEKVYAKSAFPEKRYSPPVCIMVKKTPLFGAPKRAMICTSFVERQNLNVRLFNRRFTRLTMGFSKKLVNFKHSVALFVAFWNFCWVHNTLKKTPAQAAGLTDHVWTLQELLTNKGTSAHIMFTSSQ